MQISNFNEVIAAVQRYDRIIKIAEEKCFKKVYDDTPLHESQQSHMLRKCVMKYALNEERYSTRGWDEAECLIEHINPRFSVEEITKARRKHDISQSIAFLSGTPLMLWLVSLPFLESDSLLFNSYERWGIALSFLLFIVSWLSMNSAKRSIKRIKLDDETAEIIYSDYNIAEIFLSEEFYKHVKHGISGIKNATRLAYYQDYLQWYETTLPTIQKRVYANYRIEFSEAEYAKLQKRKNQNDIFLYGKAKESDFVKSLIMAGIESSDK